ncbi:S-layer protein [uncultured archaeon]|nr:S-layer protein [uncultured archaeon]
MNSSFNNELHKFEVKNTSTGVTGCNVCHNIADHTWQQTSIHINKVTCEACHDKTVARNATGYAVSSDNTSYGLYLDPATGMISSYKNNHGTPATWPLHNISRNISCDKCHNTSSNVTGMIAFNLTGGKNCINCHDTGGFAGVFVNFSFAGNSSHKDLNSAASSPSGYPSADFKCWACHGDGNGSEASQPIGSHPLNFRTPKNCNNNDCHSLIQSGYREPMVYSHFLNASNTNNPGNVTNYNITAAVQCETCHINSLVTNDGNPNLALVSHYVNKDKLIDSFNCVYCHTVKNQSEDWGNASLIYKNRTSLYEINKEKNNLICAVGESVDLGDGYSLSVKDISNLRGDALIDLTRNGIRLDEFMLGTGRLYEYKQNITLDDDSVVKATVFTINITSIYTGELRSFIQFESTRIRKVHSGGELKDRACFACHLYRYSPEKHRFKVIDREYNGSADKDKIYYTTVLADFINVNKSKIYFNDEDYVFSQLDSMDTSLPYSPMKKYMAEGEKWNLSDSYYITLNEITTDSYQAWIDLFINGVLADDQIVKFGNKFDYTPGLNYKRDKKNVTILTGNVTSVFQAKQNFVLLQDVRAISPEIMTADGNTSMFGFNSSWLYTNDTITVGKIPENLHSPNLFTDQRKWADCVTCHDTSSNLRITGINAISSRLGKHSILNAGASNGTSLSDSIDKACWGCHAFGAEPASHPSVFNVPRNCKSCHTEQEKPYFGAKYIGDEQHGNQSSCEGCHIVEPHAVIDFDTPPTVDEITLSSNKTNKGEIVKISARATAGYLMKVRGAEYFIDSAGNPGSGTALLPSDGTFDTQTEMVTADIKTNDLSTGEHVIFVHAMERDNKWGTFSQVNFSVNSTGSTESKMSAPGLSVAYLIIGLILAYLVAYKSKK